MLAATDGVSSRAAGYIGLMTEIPPAKPPLHERPKLPDNCVDVTDQHVGEVQENCRKFISLISCHVKLKGIED